MTFFDIHSKDTFNNDWFNWEFPNKGEVEWPKWLTLPVHYNGIEKLKHNYEFEETYSHSFTYEPIPDSEKRGFTIYGNKEDIERLERLFYTLMNR